MDTQKAIKQPVIFEYEENYEKIFGWKCPICYEVGNYQDECKKCQIKKSA